MIKVKHKKWIFLTFKFRSIFYFAIFYNPKKIFKIIQKKPIFDLFLRIFQKILINQHISRSFYLDKV